jgi:hypothetical protein
MVANGTNGSSQKPRSKKKGDIEMIEAAITFERFGEVHTTKSNRRVTVPKGSVGFLLRPAESVDEHVVVFEFGSMNNVTMAVPKDYFIPYQEGPRALPLPG